MKESVHWQLLIVSMLINLAFVSNLITLALMIFFFRQQHDMSDVIISPISWSIFIPPSFRREYVSILISLNIFLTKQ